MPRHASRPWCKWFPDQYLASETHFGMNAAERGIYQDLLDFSYLEGSIPGWERKEIPHLPDGTRHLAQGGNPRVAAIGEDGVVN